MKKSIEYSEIEKITYIFDIMDIKRALVDTFKTERSDDVTLELYEEYQGKPQYAELIIKYKTDKSKKP